MDPEAQSDAPWPAARPANGTTAPPNGASDEHAPDGRPATSDAMTEDEIALYDRQIRLWGMQAQEKIRSAHVLLITMRALGNEIAKNLVLAGIGSLTIIDHETVTEADLGAQFLLAPGASETAGAGAGTVAEGASAEEREAAAARAAAAVVGTNRATAASRQLRLMNPRVRVGVDEGDIRSKGPGFFAPFSLVIATDLDPDALNVINTATRLVDRPFYAASTYGFFGYIFADLIEHDFVIVRHRSNVAAQPGTAETQTRIVVDVRADTADKEAVTKRERYSTWFLASDAARLSPAFMSSPRRVRNVTPVLPCLRALWEFQQLHAAAGHRMPRPDVPADVAAFTRLVAQKQHALGTPPVKAEHIRLFLQGVAGCPEISPVVTALGGELAQDVINVLGHTQQPIQNLLVFDGNSTMARTYALHPEGPLGRQLLSTSGTPESTAAVMAAAAAAGLTVSDAPAAARH